MFCDDCGKANERCICGYTPSAPKAITAFWLPLSGTWVINESAKTISVTVPSGTVVTSLTPNVTHTGESYSPTTAQDFTNPVTYTVTAEDGSTQGYIVTVTVISGFIEMELIPAGSFIMGSPPSEPDRRDDETQHTVTLTRWFYMGKYPVTQGQYFEVMGTNPSEYTETIVGGLVYNHPVETVTWYEAIEFCNKLSEIENLDPVYTIAGTNVTANFNRNGYRLPTEAEWEYAARGSYANTETNTKPFGIGDGTKITREMANFRGAPYDLAQGGTYDDPDDPSVIGLPKSTPVGSYSANNYGLFDMHGNVQEWCWDWYDDYDNSFQTRTSGTGTNENPAGPFVGTNRVFRGGHMWLSGLSLRSACRYDDDPTGFGNGLGFRVVRP